MHKTSMKEKDVVATMSYESPCGVLLLGSSGGRLCLCDWLVERHHAGVERRLERLLHAGFEEGTSPVTEEAARQLDGYFAGKRREFDVPLLLTGTEFQKAVWNELLKIPFGETVSFSFTREHRCAGKDTYVRWPFNIRAWTKTHTCVDRRR